MTPIPPQLPIDILETQLLPRLPAKSLGRFRCVSKSWNSFLSTPHFVGLYLSYQTNYKYFCRAYDHLGAQTFYTRDCDNIITKGPIPFSEYVCILGSLDGLLCVALSCDGRELALWNPLTRAYKKIRTGFNMDICNGAFAFYKDSCNDYKLVYIDSKGAFIYSRILDSWRKIPCLEIRHRISNFVWSVATFLKGKVYFKLRDTSLGCDWCMISFDVESEKFKEIKLPCVPCDASLGMNLVALNGCIHLCVGYKDILKETLMCDMWRMDGDEWIKAGAFASPHRNQDMKMKMNIHTKKNGNWFAISIGGNFSVKNIGLEEFVTHNQCYVLDWHSFYETIYIETLESPNP